MQRFQTIPGIEPIHFISAEGCIGVADFGTVNDNFDNVQWCDCKDVNYNPTIQSTYEQIDHTAVIHNIQKRHKSQAFIRISMLPEDTKDKVIGPAIDVRCKIDTGAGANVMPTSAFRKLHPAMFNSSGKLLKKFNVE